MKSKITSSNSWRMLLDWKSLNQSVKMLCIHHPMLIYSRLSGKVSPLCIDYAYPIHWNTLDISISVYLDLCKDIAFIWYPTCQNLKNLPQRKLNHFPP